MKEALLPKITERRLEGETFAGALNIYGDANEIDVSQIPKGEKELYFQSVSNIEVSEDGCHAIGWGVEEGGKRLTFLKDGKPLFSADELDLFPQDMWKTPDFSKLLVLTSKGNSATLRLIEEEKVTKIMESRAKDLRVLELTPDLSQVLFTHQAGDFRYFGRVDSLAGISTLFDLPGRFEDVRLVRATENFSSFVWEARNLGLFLPKSSSVVYLNNRKLAEAEYIPQVMANEDLSRVVILAHTGAKRPGLRIILNGKKVFEGEGSILTAQFTPDLSLGAVVIKEKEGQLKLLAVTADGKTKMDKKPFAEFKGFTEVPEGIGVEVVRDNSPFEMTVKA